KCVVTTEEDIGELSRLSAPIENVWGAETTANEDRKRLLRLVISEIVVHRARRAGADCEIVWASGVRQRLRVPRHDPAPVDQSCVSGNTAPRPVFDMPA